MSNCPYASYNNIDAKYYHKPMTYINNPLNTVMPQYEQQYNMSYTNLPNNQNYMANKETYYITGIYPTPHNTDTNPMGPEYQDLFNQVSAIHTQYGRPPANEREQLLYEIQLLTTDVVNYNLYLDVNPNNQEAIRLFNEYQNQLMLLTKEYEQKYGSISLASETLNQYPWNWLQGPWP